MASSFHKIKETVSSLNAKSCWSFRVSEDRQKELQSEMWGRGLVATPGGYL